MFSVSDYIVVYSYEFGLEVTHNIKEKLGNDQEMTQSERIFHS